MVHSVPLADVLAGVGFLRPLLNRLFANPHTLELCDKSYKAPSSSTPRKAQSSTLRLQGEICSWGRGKSECRCSNWIYEKRNPPTISDDGLIAPKSTARIGADARTRTPDPLFTKQPLYRLSYEGVILDAALSLPYFVGHVKCP